MRIGIITTVLVLLISSVLLSQPVNKYVNDVVQPSPNEASLGKYGDNPVSMYTGTAAPGIPIHTMRQGPLSHSIGLSYHTGGIRAEELASRVGLGWSLQAGGSVTRVINGFADEDGNKFGYYHNGHQLTSTPSSSVLTQVITGDRDGESDLYSFNCGSYSGQFYIDHDQNSPYKASAVLVPLQDVKVTINVSGNSLNSFLIVTPDGNRHHFGKYSTTTAYTESKVGTSGDEFRTTWHLLRTETYDRTHALTFGYESDNYSYTSNASCRAYTYNCSNGGSSGTSVGTSCNNASEFKFGVARFPYQTTYIEGKRLSRITSVSETVTFTSTTVREDLGDAHGVTTNKKRLDAIQISTGSGASAHCKIFDLDYSYYTHTGYTTDDDNTTVHAAKRLRLDEVQERACNNSESKEAYSFVYNAPTQLKWRHSKAIDHWGYPNGQINNNYKRVNVPYTSVIGGGTTYTYGESKRHTVFNTMLPGSLEQISYPTGGSTTYTYEANSYNTAVPQDSLLVYMENCAPPPNSTLCCNVSIPNKVESFTASELTDKRVEMFLSIDGDTGPGICSGNMSASMLFKIIRVSNGQVAFSKSVNINTSPSSAFLVLDASHFSNTMVAGVDYRFELTITNGWGNASFYGQPPVDEPLEVGGLRIKKTHTNDGISPSNDIIKTYTYEDGQGNSSGVLYYMPTYGQYLSGASVPVSGGSYSTTTAALWSTTSFVPMSSYENNHIAYDRVVEDHNGNGRTVKEYHTSVPSSLTTLYPIGPAGIEPENGKTTSSGVYNQGNLTSPISEQTITRSSNQANDISNFYMYRVSEVLPCPISGGTGTVFYNTYLVPTELYRVGSEVQILDGVSTTTTTKYDNSNRFFAPTSQTMINSDGKAYDTEYTYPHDVAGSVYDDIEDLNIITPVITTQKVRSSATATTSTITDKQTIEYALFPATTGYPYPSTYKRSEVTWTPSYSKVDDVLQATINSYDNSVGLPTSITIDGWNAETYEWYNTGLLKKRTFEDFETLYDYHSGTRLLRKVTNVDKTSSLYTYDQLFRLKTAKDSCRNVTTTLDYDYGTPDTGGNNVSSTTVYPAVTNSALSTITNKQFFDGLGRPIQTIKVKQGPTSTRDVIIATAYDNQGRVQHQYEPLESAVNNNGAFYTGSLGDYSTTTYEASPLNRPISQTHTAWNHPTTTTYGKSTSMINGIGANKLFKQTIIDADSKESITYTDTRGRTIATQMAGSGGSAPLTTLYKYDPKDRPTKIIPPGSTASMTGLNFTYEYYANDLVKYKKVPDQDQIEYRYNDRDLLIHYQDGLLQSQSKWMAYNYDRYGRDSLSGFTTSALSNNNGANPSISTSELLTQSDYYTSGNHIDKLEKAFTRELKSNGTLGHLLESNFTYDACGRIKTDKGQTLLSTTTVHNRTHEYTYDWADNLLVNEHEQTAFGVTHNIDATRTVDYAGRPDEVIFDFAGSSKSIAKTSYNEKDLLNTLSLGYKSGSGYLETCNYTYKGNQWIESMNGSLFDFTIYYNSSPHTAGQLVKNGNISEIKWKVLGGDEYAFGYRYDSYNRLTKNYSKNVTGSASNEYLASYFYDVRGNFTTIQRRGLYPDGNTLTPGLIDNLSYTPISGSNKIKTVEDNANSSIKQYGAKGSTEEFAYDANGNITKDPTKGIDSIYYYHLNLPRLIEFDHGGTIEFTYDADGNQLRKQVKHGSSDLEDRYYIGSAEYKDGQLVQVMHPYGRVARENACDQNQHIPGQLATDDTYFGDNIISDASVVPTGTTKFKAEQSVILNEEFTVAAGKVYEAHIQECEAGEWIYEYVISDHLGNSRVVFSDRDKLGTITSDEIIEQSHTYPYSMSMTGTWNNTLKHDYNYLKDGGERQRDFALGWDTHSFRSYDPSLGIWLQTDPLAEFAPDWNPYRMGFNNPISYTDPLGLFETRDEAEDYAEANGIKTGFLRRNRIREQADGTFAIENKKEGTSTSNDSEFGISTSVMVSPSDIVEDRSTIFVIDRTTRTGDDPFLDLKHDRMSPGFPVGAAASGMTTIAGGGGRFIKTFVDDIAKQLPKLDGTGKLHGGILPKIKNLGKYSKEELKLFYKELKVSVKNRIKATNLKGPNATRMQNRSHGQRQGAEQDLIKSIEKILKE